MSVRLFVEGGGDGKDTHSECRRAFHQLLKTCGLAGRMPGVIASGSRAAAYRDFCTALADPSSTALLLVDSEDRVDDGAGPWQHLRNRPADAWDRPALATDDQCHLMTQAMETWLVADRNALTARFGAKLDVGALPRTEPLENCSKRDVLAGLEKATENCPQPYRKGAVSFQVLALVAPERLRRAGPWATRFVAAMQKLAAQR